MKVDPRIERQRALMCHSCPFPDECKNCYESDYVQIRQRAFLYALRALNIPEDTARKMFRRGDLLRGD